MPTRTETYNYRVQQWHIPTNSPWLPQHWTLRRSDLKVDTPSAGRGIPARAAQTGDSDRRTWEWTDGAGTPRRVVAIRLQQPVTKTYEYHDVL